ncbi:hypothetical protein DMC47_11240 [Nostoc sp. 3335mG]|nr:hypothetical protein DMC47_11240 [Nostoc sp. 3335mG]
MGRRMTKVSLGLIAVILSLALLALLETPMVLQGARAETVREVIEAPDEAAFDRLVTRDAAFWPMFDVRDRPSREGIRELIGDCRAGRFAAGINMIAVAFDCPGQERDLVVDFQFRGDRVSEIRNIERGRLVLSPVLAELRIFACQHLRGTSSDSC